MSIWISKIREVIPALQALFPFVLVRRSTYAQDRLRSDEIMRQAQLQTEISRRSRMEFLANMSHELRTPLNVVIGFSEIIKDEVMGPLGVPVYKEYARDIYESGHHLLKIIGDILEVSKLETGQRELIDGNFRLDKALRSCLTIMSNRIEESGVTVKASIPDDLPEILGEQLAFKQILLNLINNAVKFTPKGGRVEVAAKRDISGGGIFIDVVDNGIGMTAEEIVTAMQPFGRADHSLTSSKSGTGLGLTIVESLVRLHGGQFQLVSQKGVGTTARVIVPAFRILEQPSAAAVNSRSPIQN